MSKIRLQADNNLSARIVSGVLREVPEMDFRTAQAAALHAVTDPAVLQMCADTGRILVTHDINTMPNHFREFAQQRMSPGVFIVLQSTPVATAVRAIVDAWYLSEAEEWADRLALLPDFATLIHGERSTLRPSP